MTGTVRNIIHEAGSGILLVVIEDPEGALHHVPADAGPMLRALGEIRRQLHFLPLGEGDLVINYELTDYGTLAAFDLVTDSSN